MLLDFGAFDDENGDGYPDLNQVFWPIFVDKNGQRIALASSLNSPGVAGYHFEVQVYGLARRTCRSVPRSRRRCVPSC